MSFSCRNLLNRTRGLLQLEVLSLERLLPALESLLLQLVLSLARVERLLRLAHQPTLLQETGGGVDVLEHHGVLHVILGGGTHGDATDDAALISRLPKPAPRGRAEVLRGVRARVSARFWG